jgi:folate-binding protein YgfZ
MSDYEALREGRAFVRVERDALAVTGPDAFDYLQGQLSQELTGVSTAWSLVLQPQGKVDALVRVTRLEGEAFLLDTDAGWGEPLAARLERFKLRVKVEIAPVPWERVRVFADGEGIPFDWAPLTGTDVARTPPMDEAPAELWEVLRIEAGFPRLGAELTDRTIPAEVAAAVERGVSFTKGCFTGQELVARIDSRGGNVPRNLRGLVLEGEPPAPGEAIVVDGREVGTVTSAAAHPNGHAVALGFVRREVTPPAEATVGGRVARIAALPLLS